jgi:hypothetical protein
MKKENWLVTCGIAWCIPFLLVNLPFLVTWLVLGRAYRGLRWLESWAEVLQQWVSKKTFPPDWWPSHGYFAELELIREAKRQEEVDAMHDRMTSRVQKR